MQSEGRMKTEIFLQMLQKDHGGNTKPRERSWQCPSLQGGKAGRALQDSRCSPTALARGSAMTPQALGCSGLYKKIEFINGMFSLLWVHKLILEPAAGSEV